MATQPVTSIGGFRPRTAPAAPRRGLSPAVGVHLVAPRRVAQRAPIAPQPAPTESKPKSLSAQIGGVFGGLIPGVAHMAKDIATDVTGLVRVPTDMITGDLPVSALWSGKGDPAHKYFPFMTGAAESMMDTAGRVAQLGPVEVNSVAGRKVKTYGDLIDDGEIVAGALGDIGNVALVGGAVGKALGAASGVAEAAGATRAASGLGKAADASRTVSRLGGRAGNAPLEAVGGVLKGGKSALRVLIDKGETGLFKKLPKEGTLGSRLAMRGTDEGKVVKPAMRRVMTEPKARSAHMERNLQRDMGVSEKDSVLRPSDAEIEVGIARTAGVAQAHQFIQSQLPGKDFYPLHTPVEEAGVTLTRDGVDLNAQYEAGTLPPEVMARIDRVSEATRKQSGEASDRAFEGYGSSKGPMDPAYAGDAPLNDAVGMHLVEAGWDKADVDALQQMVDQGATWEQLKPLAPELDAILLDPAVYPAPWRESMHLMGKGADEGVPNVPRTPEQMLAAGLPKPVYLPTTKSKLGQPEAPQTTPTTTGMSGGLRSLSSEKFSETRGHGPYSLATLAEGLGKDIRNRTFDQEVLNYVNHADVPNVQRVLGPDILDNLRVEAAQIADAQIVGKVSKQRRAALEQEAFGSLVNKTLDDVGYEVLPGNRAEPQPNDFDPSKAARVEDIGPASVVLPKGMKARMVGHRTGKDTNPVLAANQKVNSAFKRNVLGFNLHWTLGDAISNQIMSWVSGAVDPVTLARSMRAIKEMSPEQYDQIFNRPDFTATGLRYQAADAGSSLAPGTRAPARTKVGRGVRKIQDTQFAVNRSVNALQRSAYVLEKLERELKHKGLDSTDQMGTNAAAWADPDVQKSLSDAINDANKTFGTLDEMSPFESRVMTQIFPFWSWTRHITSLALRTAIDNPARMLWTLRLGAIGMNASPDDMPDFMRGSLPTPFGDQRIPLNWANPLYDVGSGGVFTNTGTAMRSVSPLIKLGTTLATGRDLGRNANVTSHRPGTDPSRFTDALYQGLAMSPISRGAMNLAPTDPQIPFSIPGLAPGGKVNTLGYGLGPVRRYGSGQAIIDKTTGQPAPATNGRAKAALAMVNMPFVPTDYVPVESTGKSTAKPKKRKTGLTKSGLSGGLKNTGLGGG